MSLTQAEHLFAGINESGVNDFLTAFFRARPHYLNYRTTPAVGPTPAAASAWTTIPPASNVTAGAVEDVVTAHGQRLSVFVHS